MKKSKITFRLIAAATLDGKIAKNSHHLSNWTCKEDKIFLRKMLNKGDCVVVGNNTYQTSLEFLKKRNCVVFTTSVKTLKAVNGSCLYVNPKNVNVETLLKDRNYQQVNILGGQQVYSWFLKKNLIDEIYLTVEPIVFGFGLSLFKETLKTQKNFKLKSVKKFNSKGSLLLHYTRV